MNSQKLQEYDWFNTNSFLLQIRSLKEMVLLSEEGSVKQKHWVPSETYLSIGLLHVLFPGVIEVFPFFYAFWYFLRAILTAI